MLTQYQQIRLFDVKFDEIQCMMEGRAPLSAAAVADKMKISDDFDWYN